MGEVLKGRRALVVGASAGIGREVGLHLAGLGAVVVFHGRRVDRLDEAVAAAGSGYAIVADVGDADSCEAMVEEAAAKLGGLDLVVYAASASRLGLARDLTAADWAELYAINVFGPALVVKRALPHLSAGAVIAFLSSESVGMPFHGLLPYGTSKAALEEFVRGIRIEQPHHRFCCIRVGKTEPTDFGRDFDPEMAMDLFPQWLALGRLAAQSMQTTEVGTVIAEALALALNNPSVDMQDLVLRPPGPMMTPEMMTAMLESVDATHEAVYGSEG